MTREEILDKIKVPGMVYFDFTKDEVLTAMSEFAQQEVVAATHPLQEKIDGLREALEKIANYTLGTSTDIAKQALETYK